MADGHQEAVVQSYLVGILVMMTVLAVFGDEDVLDGDDLVIKERIFLLRPEYGDLVRVNSLCLVPQKPKSQSNLLAVIWDLDSSLNDLFGLGTNALVALLGAAFLVNIQSEQSENRATAVFLAMKIFCE